MIHISRYKNAKLELASRIAMTGLVAAVIWPLGAPRVPADEGPVDAQTAQQVQTAKNKSERKLVPATVSLKHYTNADRTLGFDFPDNWVIAEANGVLPAELRESSN